jgi:hypothetical protein
MINANANANAIAMIPLKDGSKILPSPCRGIDWTGATVG